jgi:hypothetical protein
VDILLTSIVSLLAAVIGGWIAGKYAIRAQKQAAEDQRKIEQESERREVHATLNALKAELTLFYNAFVTGTEAALKEWEVTFKKDVPLNVPPIREQYFIVFDTGAAALGKIDDEELRAKILGTFYQAKILIEAINYQNQRHQERERLAREGQGHIAQRMDPDLKNWADVTIRGRLERLKQVVPSLLVDIEKYVAG